MLWLLKDETPRRDTMSLLWRVYENNREPMNKFQVAFAANKVAEMLDKVRRRTGRLQSQILEPKFTDMYDEEHIIPMLEMRVICGTWHIEGKGAVPESYAFKYLLSRMLNL